jgi:Tol biopolymer transport system component
VVAEQDLVKVLDFGLAKLVAGEAAAANETLTSTGDIVGSYPYMSPEQAQGHAISPSTDVFSFGVMLYEALTGVRPFVGSDPVSVLRAIVQGRYPRLEEVAPTLPTEIRAIVEHCLVREPGDRYADGAALHADFRSFAVSSSGNVLAATQRISFPDVSAVRWRRFRRLSRWSGGIAAALVIGGGLGAVAGRFGTERLRPDPGHWKPRVVLQSAGWLRYPGFVPTAETLVVERNTGEESEILAVANGTNETQVIARSTAGAFLTKPAVSLDGKLLAYGVSTAGKSSVEIVSMAGGPALAHVENAEWPVWVGPRRLVFRRAEPGKASLLIFDVDTGTSAPLVLAPQERSWWYVEPRPDGGLAALTGPDDGRGEIWFFPAPGAPGQRWSREARVDGFAWVGTRRTLLAVVERQLVLLRDGERRPLLPAGEAYLEPAISADGSRLALVKSREQLDIVGAAPSGGAVTCVLCGVVGAGWGSVARDGSIAYRRSQGTARTIIVRAPDGAERALTRADNASCPVFSPDGARIAYLAIGADGRNFLKVIPRDGGEGVVVAEDVAASEFVSWSPDGRSIAFAGGDPTRVSVVSAGGGPVRELTPAGGDYPQWSPRGDLIAYVIWTDSGSRSDGVWVVPVAGGKPTQVGEATSQVAWNGVGDELLQVRRGAGVLEVWHARVGEWQWSRKGIIALGAPLQPHVEHMPMTVDPRTGALVFNRRSISGELVVFEGLQPERW